MSDQRISDLSEHLRLLSSENMRLTRENNMLKACLTRQTIEAGKSFRELESQFDQLARNIYDVIVHWVALLQRPLTYDEIIDYYRKKHPQPPYTSETICRRVRELAEDGWLHSAKRGEFIPVDKQKPEA